MLSRPPNSLSARILLVDDREEDRQLLVDLLRRQGYRLYIGTDGHDAVEKARYILPDLILMDIRMPGCDGIAACRLLKADPATSGIPLIFLTAAALPEERVRGLSEGAVDYITKPYHFDEVRLRVAIHLAPPAGVARAAYDPASTDPVVADSPPPDQPRHAQPPPSLAAPRPDAVVASSVEHNIFRAAQRLLLADLAETPELGELARAVGTNTRNLNDAFRKFTGVTALNYLREARMKEACRLLRKTRLDVQTIASDLSYGNAANFATAFRERFGMSPRQFRNAQAGTLDGADLPDSEATALPPKPAQ